MGRHNRPSVRPSVRPSIRPFQFSPFSWLCSRASCCLFMGQWMRTDFIGWLLGWLAQFDSPAIPTANINLHNFPFHFLGRDAGWACRIGAIKFCSEGAGPGTCRTAQCRQGHRSTQQCAQQRQQQRHPVPPAQCIACALSRGRVHILRRHHRSRLPPSGIDRSTNCFFQHRRHHRRVAAAFTTGQRHPAEAA